jgi:hypothetical protein
MNSLAPAKIKQLFDCFGRSCGVRATAREARVSRNTAQAYLRLFERNRGVAIVCLCGKPRHRGWCAAQESATPVEALCGCGKPLRHRGWCRVRYARSPGRQAFMRRWHPQPCVARAVALVPTKSPLDEWNGRLTRRRRPIIGGANANELCFDDPSPERSALATAKPWVPYEKRMKGEQDGRRTL